MSSSNYTVIKPLLRSNSDDYYPKSNPIFGSIESCFSADTLANFNLKSIQFDFFVIWNENKYSGKFNNNNVWLKRSIQVNDQGNDEGKINAKVFKEKLIECETEDYILNSQKLFNKYNLNGSYMAIKDIPDKSISSCKCFNNYEDEPLVLTCPVSTNFTDADLRFYTLKTLRNKLRESSGGTFKMNKPLGYSDTYLEHYLSKTADITGAVWPGDCDLLLYDEEFKCKCIL
ncbi:hypothetical protein [Paraclostridium sordellii]|uniref:hypothetical protein n=1 Tax=Paraclostridium sordellii TaxID=1505 RepID=UPI0005DB4313|nr:hypothetical protein [Paeniclostridium sordellii]CEN26149.1 Uncharacterised protein [[Clostridium] sordellii] [Paeniclostridium sordellii]